MARPRKNLKFEEFLDSLSIADLKQLKKEAATEIKIKEREAQRIKLEENAKKIRDKIKIGNKVTFTERGNNKEIQAEVIGIFADKIQVETGGRKRSVALVRVVSID